MTELDVAQIEARIDYIFVDKKLLQQAFTHSSYANIENLQDNERMEFLGDAVLSQIVSRFIYEFYPRCSAGELSKIRATVVSADALRPVVEELDIVKYLKVANSSGKIKQASRKLDANLYEAVLGAIYLDGGIGKANDFVLKTLSTNMCDAISQIHCDYKTVLQEYCQRNKMQIEYKLTERIGPDNSPTFKYSLFIEEKLVSNGEGSSKKAAEQNAAKKIVEEWRIN